MLASKQGRAQGAKGLLQAASWRQASTSLHPASARTPCRTSGASSQPFIQSAPSSCLLRRSEAHYARRQAFGLRSRLLHSSPSRASSSAASTLRDLPEKVAIRTGPLGRLAKVLSPRESSKITTRVGSSFGGNHSLEWVESPRTVLLVKKHRDRKALAAMVQIIQHMNATYPEIHIVLEEHAYREVTQHRLADSLFNLVPFRGDTEKPLLASKVDFVVTLGGDGTILHVSSLFDRDAVPPVLSFSMGTLGFLLPYNISSFERAISDLISSRVSLLLRMRLHQTMHKKDGSLLDDGEIHLMNEVALHRGREPHMTKIDAFVDGRHLTQAISDGLIIATPTGSTAYSLSAGGPIVHPSVQSLVMTPICPRSLSFRTVLLPSDSSVQLKISASSRSAADVIVDGREMRRLEPGQFIQVAMSPFPIPCVNRSSNSPEAAVSAQAQRGARAAGQPEPRLIEGGNSDKVAGLLGKSERGEDDWVADINTLLKFNATFAGRGLLGGNGGYEESEATAAVDEGPEEVESPSSAARPVEATAVSREDATHFVERLESSPALKDSEVHLVGAHRHSSDPSSRIVVVATHEEASPETEEALVQALTSSLSEQGVIETNAGRTTAVLQDGLRAELEMHLVPHSSLGAAQLMLTGPQAFVDFLQMLAREGMGLRLDKWGFWKPKGGSLEVSSSQAGPSGGTGEGIPGLPPGVTIVPPPGVSIELQSAAAPTASPELSEAEKRARARALGMEHALETGLDLDLSLDGSRGSSPSSAIPPSAAASTTQGSSGHSDQTPAMDDEDGWELVDIPGNTEAHVLDVLGLVYVPPEGRDIKVPDEVRGEGKR